MFFVTDSWMNERISDGLIYTEGFNIFRSDRKSSKGGGGVLLFYKSSLQLKINELPSKFDKILPLNFEFLCVDLFIKNSTYRFLCVYLPPPASNRVSSIELLCKIISFYSTVSYPFFLIGDFNLPKIDWRLYISKGGDAHDCFFKFLHKKLPSSVCT